LFIDNILVSRLIRKNNDIFNFLIKF